MHSGEAKIADLVKEYLQTREKKKKKKKPIMEWGR